MLFIIVPSRTFRRSSRLFLAHHYKLCMASIFYQTSMHDINFNQLHARILREYQPPKDSASLADRLEYNSRGIFSETDFRSPEQIERCFTSSAAHVFGLDSQGQVVACARIISDGVSHGLIADVWISKCITKRRNAVAKHMTKCLCRNLTAGIQILVSPECIAATGAKFWVQLGFSPLSTLVATSSNTEYS